MISCCILYKQNKLIILTNSLKCIALNTKITCCIL